MGLKQFVQKNKQLWWYVKNPLELDESAVVEGVIKYGDMKEIKQLMKILGPAKTAKIFAGQIGGKRSNYDAKTVNYFTSYFKRYAR